MKVTISDVAQLAGVAKSTVSRYLNGGYVSEETGKKINKIIKETNYEPNTFAQSLKAKKTNLIGVIIPRLNSYAVSLLLKGIDRTLRENGYQMLISNTDQSVEREIESLSSFANQKMAGVILIATVLTEEHLKATKEIKIPVLAVGQEHELMTTLTYGDEQAGFVVGSYVINSGHRKLIYLGVKETDIAVGVRRKQGFKRAIEEIPDCQVTYYETSFLMEDAQMLFSRIIKEGEFQNKTLVVCATDNIAIGVMKAARKHGLEIPRDISITGFGDYEIADLIGLTTVRYPYQETGVLTAKKIIGLCEGRHNDNTERHLCELIERESVTKIC